jgi:cobalt-zinc-cadmium efflux system outer membrane protein
MTMSTRTALLAVLLVTAGVRPAPALEFDRALRETAAADPARAARRAMTYAAAPAVLPAHADGRIAPPPDELVALALQRAPSLAALAARVQEARELVRPAGALPNPMVELMIQDIGFPRWTVGEEDMSMIGPQVTQGLPFPGKRGARRRVAQAEVGVRVNELGRLQREVARDIRSLYARLYALDQEQQALSSGHELLELLAATVRERYSAGVAEQEAAIKAQLAVSRLDERLDDLAAERKGLVASLNRYLDQPGDAPLGRVTTLPETVVPSMPWEAVVVENSPEVAVRRAEVQASERRLRVARLERWPDFLAGAGVGFRGGRDPAVTLRLGLDVPLWSAQNQDPMIRAAGQSLEASRQALRDAEAAARAEAARLEAGWQKAGLQVTRYAQTIVPQSGLALDAARSSYLVGRADFSTVIEDFDLWLEAHRGVARREAERFNTWAELQAVIGSSGQENDGRRER